MHGRSRGTGIGTLLARNIIMIRQINLVKWEREGKGTHAERRYVY
jgi:hypothetical protein